MNDRRRTCTSAFAFLPLFPLLFFIAFCSFSMSTPFCGGGLNSYSSFSSGVSQSDSILSQSLSVSLDQSLPVRGLAPVAHEAHAITTATTHLRRSAMHPAGRTIATANREEGDRRQETGPTPEP